MTAPRARLILWLSTAAMVCVIAYLARYALLPFAVGAVIAYAMAPIVERLIRIVPIWNPNHEAWRRGLAVLVIYLVFLGAITATVWTLAPIAADQIAHFIDNLPKITATVREQTLGLLEEYQRRTPPEIQERLVRVAEQGTATLGALGGRAIQGTVTTLTTTVSFIVGLAIVPFWMFYAMRDRRAVGPSLVRAAPAEIREDVRMVLALTDRMLGRYIRAQLFLGLAVGVAVGVLMAVLGVDLSLGLGVWAGITELIPILGPWLGAIPGLVIVAATEPNLLPWVALVYLLVQQLENNLLVPRVQGEALDLHPAVVILLLVVGGAVWGFIGLVIVIPAAAILRELFWYLDRRLRGQTPEEAFAASHVMRGARVPESIGTPGEAAGDAVDPAPPVEVTR